MNISVGHKLLLTIFPCFFFFWFFFPPWPYQVRDFIPLPVKVCLTRKACFLCSFPIPLLNAQHQLQAAARSITRPGSGSPCWDGAGRGETQRGRSREISASHTSSIKRCCPPRGSHPGGCLPYVWHRTDTACSHTQRDKPVSMAANYRAQ